MFVPEYVSGDSNKNKMWIINFTPTLIPVKLFWLILIRRVEIYFLKEI